MVRDLRLVELDQRQGQTMGGRSIVASILVVGALLLLSVFAYSKINGAIPTADFTTEENTTLANVRSNILAGFDLSSILVVVLALVGVIGVIMMISQ